jgi:hypothetical protein
MDASPLAEAGILVAGPGPTARRLRSFCREGPDEELAAAEHEDREPMSRLEVGARLLWAKLLDETDSAKAATLFNTLMTWGFGKPPSSTNVSVDGRVGVAHAHLHGSVGPDAGRSALDAVGEQLRQIAAWKKKAEEEK